MTVTTIVVSFSRHQFRDLGLSSERDTTVTTAYADKASSTTTHMFTRARKDIIRQLKILSILLCNDVDPNKNINVTKAGKEINYGTFICIGYAGFLVSSSPVKVLRLSNSTSCYVCYYSRFY